MAHLNLQHGLPRLYPIVDAGLLRAGGIDLAEFAHALYETGIRFLQYRDKDGSDEAVVEAARRLRSVFSAGTSTLILNDRVHLCTAIGFDGAHVGQDDLSSLQARELLGPDRILGVSTHNARQVWAADRGPADYLAIGPVFGTKSKRNPDPVVGREGVAAARATTGKPLVAIGGITAENASMVLRAGADSLALISALLPKADSHLGKLTADFLARIG